MSATRVETPVLEPAAQAFAEATANPPFLFELPPAEGRKAVDEVQSGEIAKPEIDEEWVTVRGGPTGEVKARIVKPRGATGTLPVILYIHGAGWVFGNAPRTTARARACRRHRRRGRLPRVQPLARGPLPGRDRAELRRRAVDQRGRRREGPRRQPHRRRRRLRRRQHDRRADPDGQGARRRQARRPGAVLPGHRRELRHRLLPAVRRGLLPAPRRHAVVLGPVHDRRAQRNEITASPLRASLEQLAGPAQARS